MKTTRALAAALVSLALVPAPSPAAPPDHAPAHGWRKKNDPNYVGYTGKKWQKDYGVLDGRCNGAAVGAVLGGAVGGVIGSRVSSREDRPIAIIIGAALGAVVGAAVGKELDETDRGCMGHALELAAVNQTVAWTNQATGVSYRMTPTGAFTAGRTPCREFNTVISSANNRRTVNGVACRRGDGEWVFKS